MKRAAELIKLLVQSAETRDGNPERSHITNLAHNLRVGSLAERAVMNHNRYGDLKPDHALVKEMRFMGLVHDLARPLSDPFHGEVIAEMVRDMVQEGTYQVLRTHGEFQAAIVHDDDSLIEKYVDAPWGRYARALCAWELASFRQPYTGPMMSIGEAVDHIVVFCEGRD